MSDDDFIEDRRMTELYRAAARERSSPARDAVILQYARTRARRASLFRRVVVPVAAAATVAVAFLAWHAHRDDAREAAAARAHYTMVAREYLLTMQVASMSAPSAVTQYLLGLQLDGPSANPAQTSH